MSGYKKNSSVFTQCQISTQNGNYVLCDNTQVSKTFLTKLFSLPPEKLVAAVENSGVKIEVLCDQDAAEQPFAKNCQTSSSRKQFIKLGQLHGQYLPEENVILIRSSTSKGSLVHEYIHSLQAKNRTPILGKLYKAERVQLQAALLQAMDEKIAAIQKLEAEGRKADAAKMLPEFMEISDLMQQFAPWQDLIDERGIFILYLTHGKEFGVAEADLALARKNMGFICKSKMWSGKITANECAL